MQTNKISHKRNHSNKSIEYIVRIINNQILIPLFSPSQHLQSSNSTDEFVGPSFIAGKIFQQTW